MMTHKTEITSKTTTVFVVGSTTTDSLMKAEEIRGRKDLEEWADYIGLCRGGEWDRFMVIDAIVSDAEYLYQALQSITGRRAPE